MTYDPREIEWALRVGEHDVLKPWFILVCSVVTDVNWELWRWNFCEDVLLIWDWFGIDSAHASYTFEVWHDDPWICYAFEDAMQYVVMIIVCKMLKTHWDLLSVILRYQYGLVLEIWEKRVSPAEFTGELNLADEKWLDLASFMCWTLWITEKETWIPTNAPSLSAWGDRALGQL